MCLNSAKRQQHKTKIKCNLESWQNVGTQNQVLSSHRQHQEHMPHDYDN